MADTVAAAMARKRKRKSEAAAGLDEADRTLYSSFCGAANSISQLYSQSVALQKHAFRAGELHALEKLSQWMLRKHVEEPRLTVVDIMAHIEDEIDCGGSDARAATPTGVHQDTQSAGQLANSGYHSSAGSYGQASKLAPQSGDNGKSKNTSIFSNALSSPVQLGLQKYHHPPRGGGVGSGFRSTNEANFVTSTNDTAMDMVYGSLANIVLK